MIQRTDHTTRITGNRAESRRWQVDQGECARVFLHLPPSTFHSLCRRSRRGTAAMLAMLYLAILGTLALAMYSTSTLNVRGAYTLSDVARARALAESGLRWQAYRFDNTVSLPIRLEGKITHDVVLETWPALMTAVRADYAAVRPAPTFTSIDRVGAQSFRATGIKVDGSAGEFDIDAHLVPDSEPPILRVRATGRYSTGTSGDRRSRIERSAWMDFQITKKIRYAIVGRVPIQLGRNTLVEGPLGMSTANRPPPVLVLSDFKHLNSQLAAQVDAWYALLKQVRPNKFDNRISVDSGEYASAARAGYTDASGDGFVDEFDLFLRYYDRNRDGRVHLGTEFTDASGKPYDENLFVGIDGLGALNGEDKNGNGMLDPGEDVDEDGFLDQRDGYRDGVLDANDEYAKIRGEMTLAPTLQAWQSQLGSGTKIQDKMQGPIVSSDPGEDPITLGTGGKFTPDPATFAGASAEFEARSGMNAGTPYRGVGRIENTDLTVDDVRYSPPHVRVTTVGATAFKLNEIVLKATFDATNAALPAGAARASAVAAPTTADERAPYGSTSWQATYRRPVYRRIRFINVRIPKGINGLFEHCTFEGVTFVEINKEITYNGRITYDKNQAMAWSQKMTSGSFNNTTPLTPANNQGAALGNNLRFDNCTMEGPIASSYTTAYSHFSNSWEFTGATMFDNKVDETATIVAPQTNIEMGSFTSGKDPSMLIGVVVAGNIDIRGTSLVDGSIIVTGDGAGNTTLGYFGASDGDTNPGAMPEGGYGRLDIRYNEHRALPDGVNIPIMLLPRPRTYDEGVPR